MAQHRTYPYESASTASKGGRQTLGSDFDIDKVRVIKVEVNITFYLVEGYLTIERPKRDL